MNTRQATVHCSHPSHPDDGWEAKICPGTDFTEEGLIVLLGHEGATLIELTDLLVDVTLEVFGVTEDYDDAYAYESELVNPPGMNSPNIEGRYRLIMWNFRHWQDWFIVAFLIFATSVAWSDDYPRANYYLLISTFIAVVHLSEHKEAP